MRESKADFGKELGNLRTGKGVSLEELASAIKVRVELLKALEEGRFEALPPPIFVEGYLKALARYLGTEAGPLLARYRGLSQADAPPPKVQAQAAPMGGAESGGSGWLKWVLLVTVLAAAGYGVYQLVGTIQPTDSPVRRAAPPHEVQAVPAPAQALGEAPPASQENSSQQAPPGGEPTPTQPQAGLETGLPVTAPAEPAAVPPAPAQNPAEPVTQPPQGSAAVPTPAQAQPPAPSGDLVLIASGPCWCEVWADGKRVLYRMVSAGERLGFQGTAFKASVGNAGAVELVYKGQRVPLPREQGIVVKDLGIPGVSGGSAP